MICVLLLFGVGFCILLVGLFPVEFFWHGSSDSSRIILLFQWFQKGLRWKHKTWCILPATPYQFPWQQVFGSWDEFFPLPLKKTIEDYQLTPIKPFKGLCQCWCTLVFSQPPPSCCLHALGTSINHKFPLEGSKSV